MSEAPDTTISLSPSSVQPSETQAARFRLASLLIMVVVGSTACGVLAAWFFEGGSGGAAGFFRSMKANTAVAMLALIGGLVVYRRGGTGPRAQIVVRVCAGLTALIGLVTIAQHLTGWNFRFDGLLVPDGQGNVAPGHIAFTTALALLALVAAVVTAQQTARYGLAQGLAGVALFIAAFDGVGALFGLARTIDPNTLERVALLPSVCLWFLGIAFFFARPTEGAMETLVDSGPGGLIVRRLLPVFMLAPLMLAWLSWHGVFSGLYSPPFAITLVVTLTMATLSLAMLAGGRVLRGFEEKRRTAEALRLQTDARLRRAVTEAPIPMAIHDGRDFLNRSRAWIELSGYRASDTPTVLSWVERAQPEFADEMPAYLARLAAAVETLPGGEQTVRTSTGDVRVWEFSSTPLGPPGAADRMYVTTAVDITARKQAESELRRLNEELEQRIAERTAELTRANDALKRQSDQLREQALLLDLVRDGILVRDLYGTIVSWSAGAVQMYGWPRAEALGRLSHQLLGAVYPLPLKDIEEQVTRLGYWEGEVTHTTRRGTQLLVESRWTLMRTERGAPEGFMEVNRDITARKKAQDTLRDSELRFRAVAETAIEGIVSLDDGGTIRYWNPGAERIFGRPAAEAVGLSVSTVMPEPFLAAQRSPDVDRALGTTFETIGRRRDGSDFPVEISLSAWTNTQNVRSFTAIVRDITGRKQSERALEAKAEALARSNQELEQFAYVASHDLQEPLRMVSNYTQLLARRYQDKLDSEANEFIGFAVDGAKRMQELIHDLLQYARVGTRGKEFRPVPAARLVAEALANLATSIDESHAEIVIDPLPTLECDSTQMVQVFQNLIGNAVKFHRTGQKPLVRVSASRGDRIWHFSVQDNGIGIQPKYFDRIFQMFQRLHGRGEYPGTGIGLALCKKIIERHGGRIRVESEPGRGTTFSFTIPDATPPA